ALFLLGLAAPARGARSVVVRVLVAVARLTAGRIIRTGEERVRLFLRLVRVPVRRRLLLVLFLLLVLLLLGRGLAAARGLRRRVGLGGAVVVLRRVVAAGLLRVRVLGLGPVRHGGLLPGVPAAVVLRLGTLLLCVRVLLG